MTSAGIYTGELETPEDHDLLVLAISSLNEITESRETSEKRFSGPRRPLIGFSPKYLRGAYRGPDLRKDQTWTSPIPSCTGSPYVSTTAQPSLSLTTCPALSYVCPACGNYAYLKTVRDEHE